MEVHLLKSTAVLLVLLVFYKLVLEKENMHIFKRFHLLLSVVVALFIPFLSFITYQEIPSLITELSPSTAATDARAPESKPFPLFQVLIWSIYMIGLVLFAIKFAKNLDKLFRNVRSNPKVKTKKATIVLLSNDSAPHSFLNYIFLNKTAYIENRIPKEVLEHEGAHVRQRHSWDILFIELLQIFFWFHPLVYFLKGAIKLNHEFLADKAVLQQGTNPKEYQKTLLLFSSKKIQNALAHPINYSFIKKRFTAMKHKSSKAAVRLRILLVVPLMIFLLYSFSSQKIENSSSTRQETATSKMVKEYNELVSYYESLDADYIVIRQQDFARMWYIHDIMTPAQKQQSKDFPYKLLPPPPPPPPSPTKGDTILWPSTPPAPVVSEPYYPISPVEVTEIPSAPPNPNVHLQELEEEGARYFHNGNELKLDAALEVLESVEGVSVRVIQYGDHAPSVILETER